QATLDVAGEIRAQGIKFADGSVLSSAASKPPSGGGSTPSGTNIITAINDPATVCVINANRVSLNLARLSGVQSWTGANTFNSGLSANNSPITNVGTPIN